MANLTPPLTASQPTHQKIAHRPRLSWVDTAKGFGIILVVFGHVLRALANNNILAWTEITRFVDAWIYTFHMPLFFFLSGLFLFQSAQKPWHEFTSDKIRTIAYPYFVWSAITIGIKSPLGSIVTYPYSLSDLPLIVYAPIDQYWFLYVLFVLLIAVSLLLRLGATPWVIFGLALLVYPGLLPIESDVAWIRAARSMAIYMAIGLVVGVARDLRTFTDARVGWLGLCVAGGLILSLLGGWPELPYRIAIDPALAAGGISAIVALALLVHKLGIDAAIRFLGYYSLEIYLLHCIASAGLRIGLIKFAHVSDPALHLLLDTLAGLFLPIVVALFFERIGFRFGFSLSGQKRYGKFA